MERPTTSTNGWVGVVGASVLIAASVLLFINVVSGASDDFTTGATLGILASIVLLLLGIGGAAGLVVNAPNEARVLTFLGRYAGTLTSPGFSWVNPFTIRRRVSQRIRTLDSDVLKVNDANGNPIEIAAVITGASSIPRGRRSRSRTTRASSACRPRRRSAMSHREYHYDDHGSDRPSLRENADVVVMDKLRADLQQRLDVDGVSVLDTRLRRLAYAPEIAQEMLRRQQASAVVAARQLIVEGAVGMVEHALEMLNERGVVELDEDRKAAMVSNLLVVLCSDRGAQPVVNSGSRYR